MNRIAKLGSALLMSSILMGCTSGSSAPAENQNANQDTMAASGKLNTTDVPLYGAEVYSKDKVKFGKFVVRMKMVSNPGVVSSFFTYDNESWQGGIPWREIDIEVIGKNPNQFQTNLITGDSGNRIHSENIHELANMDEFHEFTVIWTPDKISWLVDGKEVYTERAEDSQQVIDMRSSPQSYRMNLWISEAAEWVGKFNKEDLPLYQYVDWIEYHSYENGEFELDWRDDFTSFDSERWGKGDWGFDSNLVTFAPENVIIKDDMLILGLTAGSKGIK
ncbi:family 16 glycosylhydrolase [Vibrio breoganii]|uniref:family 16 glycosylhydrolase n=1 Tax=Vibrio breoganii TaxID=553239 RepID=UPI0021C30EFB|nr:family 16 glycosylhydrolase [Vibrio breoganii]MDN3717716.1 family 16 glycosylhydrolase [Vibrio breoganii]